MSLNVDHKEFLLEGYGLVSANVDSERPTVRDKDQVAVLRQAWQQLIDRLSFDWGLNPQQFDDDGVEPPSHETIVRAIRVAQQQEKLGHPPPDSVVPDANGGIVFERREQCVTEILHIWSDGGAEYQQFQGTRLIERTPL